MNKNVAFYVIVVAIPLLVIAYFFFNVATLVVVQNSGTSDTEVSMVIAGGAGFERTPDKLLKANSATLILFVPQTEGELSVTCMKDGHWKGFPVGHASPHGFTASNITLQSCDRLVSKSGFTL